MDSLQEVLHSLTLKNFTAAINLIHQTPKSPEVVQALLHSCSNSKVIDEEEYQNWIHLLAAAADLHTISSSFLEQFRQMGNGLILCSSAKYSIIVVKSILHRFEEHSFSRLIVASLFALFSSLVLDSSAPDVVDLYEQFVRLKRQFQIKKEDSSQSIALRRYLQRCIIDLLQGTAKDQVRNGTRVEEAIGLLTNALRELLASVKEDEQLKYQLSLNEGDFFTKIPLLILYNLKISIQAIDLTILFVKAYFQQHASGFTSPFLTDNAITLLLMRTVCNELKVDLSAPTRFNKMEDNYLNKILNHLCETFGEGKAKNLIITQLELVYSLAQKIQIHLGSLDPNTNLTIRLNNIFVKLPFLPLEKREQFYARLIGKHNNHSFKVHLITQYRHLLNLSCSRMVWLRATILLLEELSLLEPKSSIDYIGHIISLSFFWKHLLKKFCEDPQFKIKCFVNVESKQEDFDKRMKQLKEGLQLKMQVFGQGDELKRNETSLCIFRINQMISK